MSSAEAAVEVPAKPASGDDDGAVALVKHLDRDWLGQDSGGRRRRKHTGPRCGVRFGVERSTRQFDRGGRYQPELRVGVTTTFAFRNENGIGAELAL